MEVSLVGIDPGIVDTGVVLFKMDDERRVWTVRVHVSSHIVQKKGFTSVVDLDKLARLSEWIRGHQPSHIGIEGFRQRGRNQTQDRLMSDLVKVLGTSLSGSQVVDNTGIRKVVKPAVLELFGVSRFAGTNHSDLKSAARVALKIGYQDPQVNRLIAQFIVDNVEGKPWARML